LRAGLIPALEERGFGYQFLRERPLGLSETAEDYATGRPVFIRCGRDPTSRIAEEVFQFASRPYVAMTAAGPQKLSLSRVLLGHKYIDDFVSAASEPNFLLEALGHLSGALLHTLIIILDQAEEVITLTRPLDEGRRRFFRFLQDFMVNTIQIKFVIALRKEDFGEFLSYLQFDASLKNDAKHFLLQDLTDEQIVRAIKIPTEKVDRMGCGFPFNQYRFEFAEELPDQISREMFAALPSGGVPIVMQMICQDLYNEVVSKPEPWVIDKTLYKSRKGLAGIIGQRISRALQNGFRQEGLISGDSEEEERKWRKILYKLVRRNSDGTVKSDVVSKESLHTWIKDAKLFGDPARMLDWLSKPDTLVLRSFATRNDEVLYSLGHDAIGLALHEWVLREEEAQRQRELREEEEKR
jgi:hypothetical protein